MPKRIKTVSELPKWFRLVKYENAKNLDTLGWLEQLEVRKELIINYSDQISDKTSLVYEMLKVCHENPIINISVNSDLSWLFLGDDICELKQKNVSYNLGVQSMTIRQLFMHKAKINPTRYEYMLKWWDQITDFFQQRKKIKYQFRKWIDKPLHDSSIPTLMNTEVVCVNLSLPDYVLIDHFKQFLVNCRSQRKDIYSTKPYRQPDFNEWIRFGVLPYLDLKIWEIGEKVTIPNRVMADAIFLHGECGEETVRKTIKPLVESILTEDSINRLIAKAALELSAMESK